MTRGVKILIGVAGLLGITALFAFHKPAQTAVKKLVGKIPFIGDTSPATPGDAPLMTGSADIQHIMQLQQALNDIHTAAVNINKNCKTISWGVNPGGILQVNGVFDDKTATAAQFYLNREQVDLDYLDMVRTKIDKWRQGDPCIYPLSV